MAGVSVEMSEEQAAEQMGIYLGRDTVICEDCVYIGAPHLGACRKCAGSSIVLLRPLLDPALRRLSRRELELELADGARARRAIADGEDG